MKTDNAFIRKWIRASAVLASLILTLVSIGTPAAHARVLFENDAFYKIQSEGININQDDGGDEDVTLKFGNDGTDSTMIFDDGTGDTTFATAGGDFSFSDDNITTTGNLSGTNITASGTLDANGQVDLGDNGETVTIDSSDWNINATGDMTGIGAITADGLITGTLGATITGATTSINASSNFATIIGTGTTTSAVTLGGGSNDVIINTDTWDVSSAGAMTGVTGITSTGTINFAGASRFAMTQGGANPGTCTEGDFFYNTGDNVTYVCTATDTWTGLSTGGVPTWDAIYGGDNALNTSNGTLTFTMGTGDFVIDSNDWNVDVSGNADFAGTLTATGTMTANGTLDANGIVTLGDNGETITLDSSDWDITATGAMTGIGAITMDGLLTGTAGATISGAAINLNASSNFATNIGTGTTNAAVSIGGGSNTVAIDSSSWDISTLGAISGLTTVGASGNITTSAGTFCVGSTCLNETNAAGDNGATLVATYDEFDNSSSGNVQDVLDDLDALVGSNADNAEVLEFLPEYPDTVVYADGATNKGTLESFHDATEDTNYYNWTSTQATNQDIDLMFSVVLPADFASLADADLRFRTNTNDAADNSVTITVSERVSAGTVTLCEASAATVSSVAQTWETINLTTFGGGCSLAAGDTLLIQIHLDAENADYADVGRLELTYSN